MLKVFLWLLSLPILMYLVILGAQKANLVSLGSETAFCVSQNHIAGIVATCSMPVTNAMCFTGILWVLVGIALYKHD
jgi:hypothetical protein